MAALRLHAIILLPALTLALTPNMLMSWDHAGTVSSHGVSAVAVTPMVVPHSTDAKATGYSIDLEFTSTIVHMCAFLNDSQEDVTQPRIDVGARLCAQFARTSNAEFKQNRYFMLYITVISCYIILSDAKI